jgi:glycosyltransferase involved in cell wall biosynthesis
MNAADALIHPSWSEGSPNAVKEALMCNLPVVATPVGDVRDLLRDVEPSYLVEPTIDSIRDALVACLQTPRRSNGFERSTHLTADKVAERVLNIYEGLLADR